MNQIPCDLELEAAVIGQFLLEKDAFDRVVDILFEECFYSDPHLILFRCCKWLYNNKQPIDLLTVTQAIKKENYMERVGGPYFISGLTDGIGYAENIEAHARILVQKANQRKIIFACQQTLAEAYKDSCDPLELVNKHEKDIGLIVSNSISGDIPLVKNLHEKLLERNKVLLVSGGMTGVPSGFTKLDSVTGGWQNKTLIILAARPSMGKSSLAKQFAANPAINHNLPTLVFSLEEPDTMMYSGMQSQQSGIINDKITKFGLSDYDISQLSQPLIKAPIFIDDTPGISFYDLRAKARKKKKENGIELIIIDYLQLMKAGVDFKGNREQEISFISRNLKGLSKELNVPIIALSQLSRGLEGRISKRPQLSDLRESGAIEQDADIVMFIHRPEYFGQYTDSEGNSTKGMAELIIAKHRSGKLADIPMRFEHEKTLFSDYQPLKSIYSNNVTF
jgi:replicative DNA helicase